MRMQEATSSANFAKQVPESPRLRKKPVKAVLGKGARFEVVLGPGDHEIEVRTCPFEGRNGFYLVRQE